MIKKLVKEDMYSSKYLTQLRSIAKLYKDDIIQHGGEDEDAILSMIIDIAQATTHGLPEIKNLVARFLI